MAHALGHVNVHVTQGGQALPVRLVSGPWHASLIHIYKFQLSCIHDDDDDAWYDIYCTECAKESEYTQFSVRVAFICVFTPKLVFTFKHTAFHDQWYAVLACIV